MVFKQMMVFKQVISPLPFVIFCFLLTAFSSVYATQNKPWVLTSEQWEMNRSGSKIVKIPVLKKVIRNWMNRYETEPNTVILLHYPGGEEGELWVQELTDWLVALGVPSKSIMMVPGSDSDDMIGIELGRR